MPPAASRRTVLAAALAAAAGAATAPSAFASSPSGLAVPAPASKKSSLVDYHGWSTAPAFYAGRGDGVRVLRRGRAGIAIARPAGTLDYTDPHTNTTATWEYATWLSPLHTLSVPATEAVASWNADTPAGTWIQVELKGRYNDGTQTPWFMMGRWAAGDDDIKRTSLDDQTDGKASIWTDTFAVDDASTGLRLLDYRLRVTLFRKPGSRATPVVWRAGAMGSDIPDRFEVPASSPRRLRELAVPRYSQNIHAGEYPEYDNGGEAWCSPTSSTMALAWWGHRPTKEQMAWVDPSYADPEVDYAARFTYDYQYEGCGNWPFNAAYAATFPGMNGVVTRLRSLNDMETLTHAGIPVVTSQSFISSDLDGAGYSTSGHLMCIAGFTPEGDVVANDPASSSDEAVRNVYRRRQFENVWLRTKRINASGGVSSGTGGIVYVFWPVRANGFQRSALRAVGIR